jgi:phosphatidylserine decarboxylase
MKLADRRGNIEECSSGQDRLLEWIYTHETGRFLMKGLINPHISEIGAAFLDSRASRVLIAWFIRKNKIPMYQYEQKKYRSVLQYYFDSKIKYDPHTHPGNTCHGTPE